MKLRLPRFLVPAVLLLAATVAGSAQTTVTTDPVGFVQATLVPSSDGTVRKFTAISFPLHQTPIFVGLVASVSGSTVNLTGSSLGDVTSAPYLLHVKSAVNSLATGRSFLITLSSSTSVTVNPQGVPLSAILSGSDQVGIYQANTLGSVFGAIDSDVQLKGGSTVGNSDVVYMWNGNGWGAYFYIPTYGWVLNGDGSFAISNNTPIYPDEGVLVGRISTATLPSTYAMIQGTVPTNTQNVFASGGGSLTFVSNPLPTPVTFAQFGFTSAPSWLPGNTAGNADNVYLWQNNGWLTYFYISGYGWVLNGDGSFAVQDNTAIPAGAAFLVRRRTTISASNSIIPVPLTYSLN